MKFNVHSRNVKQVMVLEAADRRMNGRMTTIGIPQNLTEA